MSKYTAALDWCKPVGGILYTSTKPLVWEVGVVGSGFVVTVPAGRTFDVSIPRGLRWLFSPHDPAFLKAAALHDELLHVKGWSRDSAAGEFHRALCADGVAPWRRIAMTAAVFLFKYS